MISQRVFVRIFLLLALTSFLVFQLFRAINRPNSSYKTVYKTAITGKKGVFVQGVADTEIDGPFESSSLKALCQNTTWTPGLIIKCEPPSGGVGIVRNVHLNCLRFAIEAGATSFIIPEMIGRGKTMIAGRSKQNPLLADAPDPFERFVDLSHFTRSLGSACPQIHLIPHANELWDKPSTAKAIKLDPYDLSPLHIAEHVLAAPRKWAEAFHNYLDAMHPKAFSESLPVLVVFKNPLLEFPLGYDDPHLVANFGKLLRFRADVRRLAGTVLHAMNKKYKVGIKADHRGVQLGTYYGAHLRTEADAAAANWTDYNSQTQNYLNHANSSNLKLIYLATGNEKHKEYFTEDAASFGISAVTKEDLLSAKGFEKELVEMQALGWEQKLLIDYLVLLRSSLFGGTHESSFAWNIAMRRHVVVGNGSWTPVGGEGSIFLKRRTGMGREELRRGNKVKTGSRLGEGQSFRDELSTVFGPWSEGRVFRLSMWP